MDPFNLRRKFERFRILIIGRANAGKTTILQRVCSTRENPEIYNSAGEKIDPTILIASRERGQHDIENEMVFRNNPGFVFHDSCGFEAGGESEFTKVKAFITSRSKKRGIKDRIHAIWYCIPMDEESRSWTEGEVKFFSQCDTGSIPVVVLFTKFDALYDDEFAELTSKGESRENAKRLASMRIRESFANGPQVKLLYNREGNRRPPNCHICLADMNMDDADCGPLIERTAETLDHEALKRLFISTQQTNLELCMKYAVERTLAGLVDSTQTISSRIFRSSKDHDVVVGKLGAWFPNIWTTRDDLDADDRDEVVDAVRDDIGGLLGSGLLSFGSSTLEQIVQLSSAAVIIFEHSFHLWDQRRYLQAQQDSDHPTRIAIELYMSSPSAVAVRDALSTAVHKYQANSSSWKAKFKNRPLEGSQRKAELINTILDITLQHRLPKPSC